MAGPKVQALPEDAREDAEYAVRSIREGMRRDHGTEAAELVRSESMGKMLSLSSARIRDLVSSKGTRQADGTTFLEVPSPKGSYELVLGTAMSGKGEPVPSLDVMGLPDKGRRPLLFNARFFNDRDGKLWCAARGRTDREMLALEALDAIAAHLPAWDGTLQAGGMTALSAEAEMVRADGGFLGETCREHLDALRRETVLGTLTRAVKAIPRLVPAQAEAGYVWGKRYLAYDDTDKRACGLRIPGLLACFHENVDLIDDNSRWIAALEMKDGRQSGTIKVWAFDRSNGNPVTVIEAALSAGQAALGEPNVSLDTVTGIATIKAGLDSSAVVSNVLHGLERDNEVFADLKKALKVGGTETRTDFSSFAHGTCFPEDVESEEGPASPAP